MNEMLQLRADWCPTTSSFLAWGTGLHHAVHPLSTPARLSRTRAWPAMEKIRPETLPTMVNTMLQLSMAFFQTQTCLCLRASRREPPGQTPCSKLRSRSLHAPRSSPRHACSSLAACMQRSMSHGTSKPPALVR